MTIVNYRADGQTECFMTDRYLISTVKDLHPLIIKVEVYDNGRKVAQLKRPFSFWYRNVTFKSHKVQEELRKMNERELKEDK